MKLPDRQPACSNVVPRVRQTLPPIVAVSTLRITGASFKLYPLATAQWSSSIERLSNHNRPKIGHGDVVQFLR